MSASTSQLLNRDQLHQIHNSCIYKDLCAYLYWGHTNLSHEFFFQGIKFCDFFNFVNLDVFKRREVSAMDKVFDRHNFYKNSYSSSNKCNSSSSGSGTGITHSPTPHPGAPGCGGLVKEFGSVDFHFDYFASEDFYFSNFYHLPGRGSWSPPSCCLDFSLHQQFDNDHSLVDYFSFFHVDLFGDFGSQNVFSYVYDFDKVDSRFLHNHVLNSSSISPPPGESFAS